MTRQFKNPPEVRIIGGQWRGRKLPFKVADGLRPTGDRTREMLFNWLQWDVRGSRCLDLFAGSGALGFEAASRGADFVALIDADRETAALLEQNRQTLDAKHIDVCHTRAEDYLHSIDQPFDIVFVDPPFAEQVAASICDALRQSDALHARSLIYVETPKSLEFEAPKNWRIHKHRTIAQINAHLYTCDADV
ncbi:MAG: 16S rRNA (guanine(966)-N(2))-methyltransferase RsmD [Pseudomonadota bacterium]